LDINFDLAVSNGRVFTPQGLKSIEIWIREGRIAALGGSHRAAERIDARGMLVLPGCIDAHVHFRDPGQTYKEDWLTGSVSAAAGGVSTVIDQPNTDPRTLDRRSFELKLQSARARSVVDYCINGGPGRIEELKKAGVQAIGEIFSYEHSDTDLAGILARTRGLGLLATVHAEDGSIIRERTDELSEQHDPSVHSLARPVEAELRAIEKVLAWSDRLHICHLSSGPGLRLIERARQKRALEGMGEGAETTGGHSSPAGLSCEVTTHHLLLNVDDYRRQGSYLKMNPPLRSQADNERLWDGLRTGSIDILASDHAPHLPEEKAEEIWEAPSGVPGVETMLPLMLFAVRRNFLSLERLVDALATRPARIFSLAHKGSIGAGMDADLVLVDSKRVTEIRADRLHSRAEWTPYEGMKAIFPRMTIIRGSVVWDDGLEVEPGYGRFQGMQLQ
jgi:dihydroorotase